MKILQGQGVSKGVEHGPIYFCRRSQTLIQPDKADDPRFQGERLDRAMEQTAQQLGQMAELARAQAGDSAAQLFETHAMFLEDEDYTGALSFGRAAPYPQQLFLQFPAVEGDQRIEVALP